MPAKKYKVTLTEDEKELLGDIINKGKQNASKRKRAQALLLADEGYTDDMIAERTSLSRRGLEQMRQRFVEEGFESTLEGKPKGHRPRALQGEDEARLVALVCGPKPDGRTRWTLRLLADTWTTLAHTDTKTVSHQTISRTLKKNDLKPWRSQEWCIPAEQNADFVAAMEDILDVYTRKHDKKRPLVCMDESPKQLIGETRIPLNMKKGIARRYDTEYVRNGTCELFMFVAPLEGWRRAEVTERRTKKDWSYQIKKLVDIDFPQAEKIILVMDNLNTHTIGSLYEAFPPEEARRIREKLEIHFTPKHGSWLNMAETELNVLINHGLSVRVPTMNQMQKETKAWKNERNATAKKITWRFTTEGARIKLHRLYPLFE